MSRDTSGNAICASCAAVRDEPLGLGRVVAQTREQRGGEIPEGSAGGLADRDAATGPRDARQVKGRDVTRHEFDDQLEHAPQPLRRIVARRQRGRGVGEDARNRALPHRAAIMGPRAPSSSRRWSAPGPR